MKEYFKRMPWDVRLAWFILVSVWLAGCVFIPWLFLVLTGVFALMFSIVRVLHYGATGR